MTDSERLNAIGEYGLCVVTHDVLSHSEWQRTWVCQFSLSGEARVVMGPSIRDVIDAAVQEIEAYALTTRH